jgi:exopolysaccharide production protein ExoZ
MRYSSVQALRAIAASVVVIGHSSANGLITIPNTVAFFGYSGVDIFFVISGFIICQVATRHSQHQMAALHFLARRCLRIFPLYWIVLAFSVFINVVGVSTVPPGGMPWQSTADYLLLLTTANRFVPASWTLVFELYFYVSVSIILLVCPANRFYQILALWIGVQAALILLLGPSGGPPTNALTLEFGLGCAVAWLNTRNLIRHERVAAALGVLFFACGAWWCLQVPATGPGAIARLLTFGIGSALCLYTLVGLERRRVVTFPNALVHLGDASYSLYLWHLPLIAVAVALGIGGVAVPLIFAVAFVSYYFIEAPLLRLNVVAIAAALVWQRSRGAGAMRAPRG